MTNISFPVNNTWWILISTAILFAVTTVGLLWVLLRFIPFFKVFSKAGGAIVVILNIISILSCFIYIILVWWLWTRWAYFSE